MPLVLLFIAFLEACSGDDDDTRTPDKPLEFPSPDTGDVVQPDSQITRDSEDGFFDSIGPDAQPDAPVDTYVCHPDPCDSTLVVPADTEGRGLCVSFIAKTAASYGLNSTVPHRGFELLDINDDGRMDLYIKNQDTGDQIFESTGTVMKDVTSQWNLKNDGLTRDVLLQDVDGDGLKDLFVVGESKSQFLRNTGNTFAVLPTELGISFEGIGKAAAWVGGTLLLSTDNGTKSFRHQSGFEFVDTTGESGLIDFGDGAAIVTADFDGDGSEDAYLANQTGSNRLFYGNAAGNFESVERIAAVDLDGSATDTEVIFMNSQNNPSIFVTNYEGLNHLYYNNQDGTYSERAQELGLQDPGFSMSAAHAFLGNQDWPLFYLTRFNQSNLLMVPDYNGAGEFVAYRDRSGLFGMDTTASTLDGVWLDVNGDGLPDAVTATAEGAVQVFINESREIRVCP